MLNGVRIVELATVIAAPSATAVLADYGADVIKVEEPAGDYFRKEAIVLTRDKPHGPLFENVNRGKRSVVLDLKKEADKETMKRLLATADVFVTNVRPAALERLGFDYETLHRLYPRLVYAHLHAWGMEGPNKDMPGYDAGAFFAATGMQDLLRPNDEADPPRYPGGFGDLATSMQLVAGIGLALFHRERTGLGQLVDACLYRCGIWMLGCPLTVVQVPKLGKLTPRTTRGRRTEGGFNPIFNTFRTKDGRWLQMLGLEVSRHLDKTLRVLGLAEQCKQDPRFNSIKACLKNKAALVALLDKKFAERTLAEWVPILDKGDVWYTVTKRYEDIPADPQAQTSFVKVPGVDFPLVAAPVRFSCAPHRPQCGAPALGAHTKEVLSGLS
eukprot:TRINITY_DN5819_c0_g2_i1.p1 TRINITY_DN5819_c0_g2~~TRINITY_DN5819_c0_g2_i1.p1  ORF type:complete len:448 (+),score=135.61 TRINITY_DN5819_c0_g2_i1:191-1345(+)